ncbi:cyclic nucleotide-binding domain-containing protein [Desulfococcaceae bacterium HSG7]|nr:cyclic nucleotide-binding domain-containing protein [Desulfococcaceae bacterium HSG9]MDM8553820.1 cyclic nucleotide-binding domain-containing protein [Desulfococcaceae bacterium HSG7]
MIESKYLQDNIQNIQKLYELPTLKHFETHSLGRLLRLSKIRQYEQGELIIKEGDTDPWLYFLLSGSVRVVKEGIGICEIDKKGEIFGEMRILDNLGRSASVYAEGTTICLAVDTLAKDRLKHDGDMDERLDLMLLLYRIFAEYMSIRLRVSNEEVLIARKENKALKRKLKLLIKKQSK